MADDAPRRRTSRVLIVSRFVLPAIIAVAGVVLTIVGTSDAMLGLGTALIGVAVLVVLLNVFMQLSIRSNDDRDREQRARDYFDRHGRWPGPSKRP